MPARKPPESRTTLKDDAAALREQDREDRAAWPTSQDEQAERDAAAAGPPCGWIRDGADADEAWCPLPAGHDGDHEPHEVTIPIDAGAQVLQVLTNSLEAQARYLDQVAGRLAQLDAWAQQQRSEPQRVSMIHQAMARALQSVEPVEMRQVDAGPGGRFQAKKIDDVLRVCRAALAEHGIMIIPTTIGHQGSIRETRGGAAVHREDLDVLVTFSAEDGSSIVTGPWKARGEDSQDKSFSKAYSYAIKTCLIVTFMLTGALDEPDENAPGETGGRQGQQARQDRGRRPAWAEGWLGEQEWAGAIEALRARVRELESDRRQAVKAWFERWGINPSTWQMSKDQADKLDAYVGLLADGADPADPPADPVVEHNRQQMAEIRDRVGPHAFQATAIGTCVICPLPEDDGIHVMAEPEDAAEQWRQEGADTTAEPEPMDDLNPHWPGSSDDTDGDDDG